MRILCLDVPNPGYTIDDYMPHMNAETLFGWELYKNGTIRDLYFRQDRLGVALFTEFDSVEECKKVLAEFPLAKAGLIGWDVIPLGPFTSWEMLFKKD